MFVSREERDLSPDIDKISDITCLPHTDSNSHRKKSDQEDSDHNKMTKTWQLAKQKPLPASSLVRGTKNVKYKEHKRYSVLLQIFYY